MLDTLKSLFTALGEGSKPAEQFGPDDYRVAAAALLIHVMSVDGADHEAERNRLRSILQQQFVLDDNEADRLVAAATEADREAIDLYRFTSLLNRTLDEAGRLRVVEMMWEIVFADGRVNEFEDNVLWRAADLLGISARERLAMRRRVAGSTT